MSWFTQPWGLLGLLAVPAVVALHLFRRRFQDMPVAALFLWEDAQRSESTGRKRQPLRRTPSFWLEIAAAALAGLLLAGFDPLAGSEAKHLVAVLDDSASMAHAPRRQAVIDALEERFAEHGRRTRVTLVRSGVRPRLLCGPAVLLPDARAALANWQPSAPAHLPEASIDLARELANGGEILYLTDALLDDPGRLGQEVRVLAFGESADNLAIADARRSRGPDGEELRVLVRSYASVSMQSTLRISSGANELTTRQLELEANGEQSLRVPLPTGTPSLTIRLDPDALLLDNEATLHPPVDRRVRLGIALDEADATTLRAEDLAAALPDVIPANSLAEAHLILAHQVAPAPAWSLVLPHNPEDSAAAEAFVRGFIPDKAHPLLRDLTFEGVVWTRSRSFELPGMPLLSVADYPLLTERVVEGAAVFHLNMVAPRSTLALSPDWPIFLSNLVALRRAALPGPRAVNLVAGESFELRRSGRLRYQLSADQVEPRELFAEDLLQIDALAPAAAYRLESEDGAAWTFAVNFRDARESDLRDGATDETPPHLGGTDLSMDRYAESPAARILLLILIACIAADWWVLRGTGRARA
jgi:hypothetical protein